MSDLFDAFVLLPFPPANGAGIQRFESLPVVDGSPHLFAKSTDGHACLLIATGIGPVPAPIQLEYLTVQHSVRGAVHATSSISSSRFSVITLRRDDEDLVRLFLRFAVFLVDQFGSEPKPQEVADEVRRLTGLLQQLRRPSTKTVQGLWAELFVMNQRRNSERWLQGWHVDPEARHDFFVGGVRVEVKSSSGRLRRHHFSHEQLSAPRNAILWVASVLVERSGSGLSVFDLVQSMHQQLTIESSMILDEMLVRTLGSDFDKAGEFKYDLAHSQDTLLFYPLDRIPRLSHEVPERVSDISYSVQLLDSDGQRDLHFA